MRGKSVGSDPSCFVESPNGGRAPLLRVWLSWRHFGEVAEELRGGHGVREGEIPPGRCRALSAARKPCRVHFSSLPSSLAPIVLGFPAYSGWFPLNFPKVWCFEQLRKSAEAIWSWQLLRISSFPPGSEAPRVGSVAFLSRSF